MRCGCDAAERRGWRIVVVAFVLDALSLGGRGLFSVTLLYFEEMWSWERNTSSALNSLVHILIALSTIVNGHIADKCPARVTLGCGLVYLAVCYGLIATMKASWHAWLVYGVMTGWAWGALNLNVFSVAVVNALPERQHSLAVGIANTGSTFGMMALVPLFDAFAARRGWREGYVVLAAAVALLAVVAFFMLRSPGGAASSVVPAPSSAGVGIKSSDQSQRPIGAADPNCADAAAFDADAAGVADASFAPGSGGAITAEAAAAPPPPPPPLAAKLCTLFTSRAYWLLSLAFVICGITTTGFIETHIVALAVSRGDDASVGAIAFSVLSACNGVGMILAGWLADRVSRTLTLCGIFALRGLSFLVLLWSTSRAALLGFAILFGIVDYSVVPPVISLVGSHAGQHTVGLGGASPDGRTSTAHARQNSPKRAIPQAGHLPDPIYIIPAPVLSLLSSAAYRFPRHPMCLPLARLHSPACRSAEVPPVPVSVPVPVPVPVSVLVLVCSARPDSWHLAGVAFACGCRWCVDGW